MADQVTYSRIVELLDNSQYIEALKKAEAEEKLLANLREAGGQAAVKAYRATEAAAKQAAKETERAARGPSAWTLALEANTKAQQEQAKQLTDLRGQINLGAESLGKLGSALSLVSPELATLTGGLQKVTGVFSAGASGAQLLGSGLTTAAAAAGVVAAAASPLILIWQDVADAQEAAAAAAKVWNELQDDGLPLIEASKAAQKALALELSPLSKAEKERTTIAEKWQGQLKTVNAATQAQIDLINAQIAGGATLDKINTERVARGEEELSQLRKTGPEFESALKLRKQLEGQLKANSDAAAAGFEAERKLADLRREDDEITRRLEQAENDLEASRRNGEKATREAEQAARERERAEAALLKSLLDQADAEIQRSSTLKDAKASLASLKRTSEEALATDEERIRMAAQVARETAVAAANEAQAASDSAAERKRIAQDLAATIININVDEARKFKALEEEKTKTAEEAAKQRAKAARDEMEDQIAAAADLSGAASDLLGTLYDRAADAAEDGGKRQKETALALWKTQQTAAIGEAGINAILAVSKALASAPPPLNLLPAGVAAAQGAAQVAAIAAQPAPTFSDTPPGGWRPTESRRTATFAADDTVIAARDPRELIRQAVAATVDRQMARPPVRPARRDRRAATTPTARLLTTDLERTTRGRA